MNPPEQWVLAVGNVFDGLYMIGTFASCDEAAEYANSDRDIRNEQWNVVLLQAPADLDCEVNDEQG